MLRQLLFIGLALIVVAQLANGESDCKKERDDALNAYKEGLIGFTPSCDDNGNYKKSQCNGSTGYCYCVDPKTGKMKGEPKRGKVNCDE